VEVVYHVDWQTCAGARLGVEIAYAR